MNENLYSVILVLIAFFIIFTVIFLIPQAIGLAIYRFLRPHSFFLALLFGFLAPLILYCAIVGYFWYSAPTTPASELPGGEGDIVGPAIIGFGFILNTCGGTALYLYLFIKNKQPRVPVAEKLGAEDLP